MAYNSKLRYSNLGEATSQAQANANRDQCRWYIRHYDNDTTTFVIADEFTKNPYPVSRPIVRWVQPQKRAITFPTEAVVLTPEEKALVAAVLDPKEPGRDYYGGTEKARTSLWKKLIGGK